MKQEITVELDDEVVRAHEFVARSYGASLAEELRRVLTAAVRPYLQMTETERLSKLEALEAARKIRESNRPGNWPSVVDMVREDRDNDEPYR